MATLHRVYEGTLIYIFSYMFMDASVGDDNTINEVNVLRFNEGNMLWRDIYTNTTMPRLFGCLTCFYHTLALTQFIGVCICLL